MDTEGGKERLDELGDWGWRIYTDDAVAQSNEYLSCKKQGTQCFGDLDGKEIWKEWLHVYAAGYFAVQ